MNPLPYIFSFITGKARYKPEIEWSDVSWTHNVFRFYEMIFWRRYGIRAEASTRAYKKDGIQYEERKFFTIEAFIAYAEGVVRKEISRLIQKGRMFDRELMFTFRELFDAKLIYAPMGFSHPGMDTSAYRFAIAFDATSKQSAANPSTMTIAHTCTGSNLILFTSTIWFDSTGGAPGTVTLNSVVYAGSGGTKDNHVESAAGTYKLQAWRVTGPSTGANNNVLTWSAAINDNAAIIACSYTGASQGTQPDNSQPNSSISGTSITTNITPVANDCMLIDMFGDVDTTGAPTAGGGQTERNTQTSGNGFLNAMSEKLLSGGGGASQSMQYTKNGVAGRLLHIVISIAPAGGAAATSTVPTLLTMGVGL